LRETEGEPARVKEANTRYIENIHLAHLVRILGARTAVCTIGLLACIAAPSVQH
jgi:hypothetical protein